MGTTLQDLRYGLRMLVRRPTLSVIAIVSLALGIGANTAAFSMVETMLLRPLPIFNPGEVFSVYDTSDKAASLSAFSYPDYVDFRDRNEVLAGIAAYRFCPISLSYSNHNERMWGYLVSGNYFDVLGVKTTLGRTFLADEDRMPNASPVAVLSYEYWKTRFNSNPGIAGESCILNGHTFKIIGVAAKGFFGTEVAFVPDVYVPMMMASEIEPGSRWLTSRSAGVLQLFCRVKPGVNRAQAQSSIGVLAANLWNEQKRKDVPNIVLDHPGLFFPAIRGQALTFAAFVMAIVGLVLLIACSNLAGLLLARATERSKEMAIRIAIGAGKARLVKQLLTESLVLSLFGGAAGFLLALWANNLLRNFKPPVDFALNINPEIDFRVLVFAVTVSLLAGVVFGLAPAIHSVRADLVPALKNETAAGRISRTRLRSVLVATQVALSLVLLLASGLILRSLRHAEEIDPGFNTRNGVEMTFDVGLQGYDQQRGLQFMRDAADRVSSLPRVKAVTLTDNLPLGLDRSSNGVYIEGRPWPANRRVATALYNVVWPGYFKTMGIQLVEGREFTFSDTKDSHQVVIVNEEFVRQFLPGEEPVGKRASFSGPDGPFCQIVAVARNGKYLSLDERPQPFVHFPLLQRYNSYTVLVARVDGNARAAIGPVRSAIQQLDPTLPITDAKTPDEHMGLSLFPARVAAVLLGIFGLLALTLAAIGIFGVVSYSARQRTREIGIRMALGARRQDVLHLVVLQGMTVVAIGLVVGLAGAFALTRFLSSLLYGVSPTDPVTFLGITVLLGLVAFSASYVPALRATNVEPMRALRYE